MPRSHFIIASSPLSYALSNLRLFRIGREGKGKCRDLVSWPSSRPMPLRLQTLGFPAGIFFLKASRLQPRSGVSYEIGRVRYSSVE